MMCVQRSIDFTTSSWLTYSSSITHIMGGTIDQLYGQNLGSITPAHTSETLSQVSDLLSQLDQWQEQLPRHLRAIEPSENMLENASTSLEITRLRVLLSLRYLGARILVLRTILIHFFPPSGRESSNEHLSEWLLNSSFPLIADLVRTCLRIFQLSSDLLAASTNNQNLLGAWWFSCHYSMLFSQNTYLSGVKTNKI
jgi:hypothetical protein